MLPIILIAVVAGVIAFAVGWWVRDVVATRPRYSRPVAEIDLVPAAARGELDLSWDDPRPVGGSVRA